MERELYYSTVMRRENVIKAFFLSTFNLFASGARLMLEVFIKRNFGERYFKLSSVILLSLELAALPFLLTWLASDLGGAEMPAEMSYNFDEIPASEPPASTSAISWPGFGYVLWYIYIIAFIVFGIKHHQDNKRLPSVFNFEKFSLSNGQLSESIGKLPYFKDADVRVRECFLEPALFLIIGVLLAIVGQYLGWLLIICSFFYSVSYIADYESGDNFIMDKIDEIILNKALASNFINGTDYAETDGMTFRARRPNGADLRRELLQKMMKDDAVVVE